MSPEQIKNLTDWLAVHVMHMTWYDGGDHFASRWLLENCSNGPSEWNPAADANDCKMLTDQMRADGWVFSLTKYFADAWTGFRKDSVLQGSKICGNDPNELLATCIAAREAKKAEMGG